MPAPNDRDDVLEAIREGREAIDEFGLRRTYVYTRTRRWYTGSAGAWAPSGVRGRGFPVDTEVQVLPTPRVRQVSVQYIVASAGRYRDGDIVIDKVTPKNEPTTGTELHLFDRPVADPSTERHVMLVERGGTPWHLREGTARLLTPGPYDVPTAVTCANALRAAYPAHWSDPYAHTAPGDPAAAPGVPATDLVSAITLAGLLRTAWVAHRANVVLHPEADPYPVTAPAPGAGDAQALLVLLHDLLRVFNAHVASGRVSECEVLEARADRPFTHTVVVRPTRRTP